MFWTKYTYFLIPFSMNFSKSSRVHGARASCKKIGGRTLGQVLLRCLILRRRNFQGHDRSLGSPRQGRNPEQCMTHCKTHTQIRLRIFRSGDFTGHNLTPLLTFTQMNQNQASLSPTPPSPAENVPHTARAQKTRTEPPKSTSAPNESFMSPQLPNRKIISWLTVK